MRDLTPRRIVRICRMLGIGLITVSATGRVTIRVEPGPYRPRMSHRRRNRLVEEHARRRGDPTPGGTSGIVMSSYRQQALQLAALLMDGPRRLRDLRAFMPQAREILTRHSDWFVRPRHGVYGLTKAGRAAVEHWWPMSPSGEDG